MEQLNSGIYIIINKINGKIYIGSSVNLKTREREHFRSLKNNKHHSQHLQYAYNHYGKESFKFGIIEYVSKDKELLLKREQYWLDYYQSYDMNYGYNIAKYAESPMRGRHQSKEAKDKMSIYRKGRLVGENNPNYGRYYTEEEKKKIGKKSKGRLLGSKSKSAKKVINLTDGTIWESIADAARAYNISKGNIIKICKGVDRHTFSGGCRWAYYYPEVEYLINPDTKKTRIKGGKQVINLETLQIFSSTINAGKYFGINNGSISCNCLGKYKSAGKQKYHFMYYNDYKNSKVG
jgi:group I intron endonuclease